MNGRFIDSVILKREIDKDSYLTKIPAVQYLQKHHSISFDSNVTFFVGENETGKSTLSRLKFAKHGFI